MVENAADILPLIPLIDVVAAASEAWGGLP